MSKFLLCYLVKYGNCFVVSIYNCQELKVDFGCCEWGLCQSWLSWIFLVHQNNTDQAQANNQSDISPYLHQLENILAKDQSEVRSPGYKNGKFCSVSMAWISEDASQNCWWNIRKLLSKPQSLNIWSSILSNRCWPLYISIMKNIAVFHCLHSRLNSDKVI